MQQCFRDSRQESNLQDFSINPSRNSPSRLIRKQISQDISHDENIPLNQNSMFFRNYRRFPQQEPRSKNFIEKNYLNNSPKFLDRRETFSQDKPARRYPLVVPSRQVFDRSKNLFFRNPRNKYSESLSEDYKRTKDYEKNEEDPMSKVLAAYRADSDIKPSWENSRDTSNVIQSERSFPKENIYRFSRKDVLDEERNAIKKSSNSASQLTYPRERYNLMGLGPSEVKRTPHVKDTDIMKSTKEFFDNWDIAKDSSQFTNLEQLKNNLLEVHPAKKPEIIAKNNNKQINSNSYNSKFPQSLNTWESRKDEESLDSLMRINTRPFVNENDADMKDYFEDETEYFMSDEDTKEYFEDEIGHSLQDTVEQDTIERDDNPHDVPQNIWKDIENEELLDDLDFMRENSRKTEQSGLYSEENDKDEDVIFQDKAYTSAEVARAPVINAYNAYILPRNLNIVNDKKYPAKFETQELSEAKNGIRANPIKKMDQRFFEDEAVIENSTHIQDYILPKDIFDVEEYSNPIVDKRNNLKNKNEALIELDPDLLDDIEDPPIETTESTT